MKVWLTLAEAAAVAGRTERSIRNWVEAGELELRYGRFKRDEVLATEKRMRQRIGRPKKSLDSE
ncbi:hypothetical protein NS234_12140 [Microbacterium oxydans]|nr:hypothetical protein NS234_12140 [Microbacterium oxydans]